MRLLHFGNSQRLAFTDFSGRTIPPYAILSHVWGTDEVLFGDIRNEEYRNRAGYQKIEFCATKAAQHRLTYFWIDTCCIDKYNRRVLSKASNSMFDWYANATICFVFLGDVSVSPAMN